MSNHIEQIPKGAEYITSKVESVSIQTVSDIAKDKLGENSTMFQAVMSTLNQLQELPLGVQSLVLERISALLESVPSSSDIAFQAALNALQPSVK